MNNDITKFETIDNLDEILYELNRLIVRNIENKITRITVELTKYCPVGCKHCKYFTPLPSKEQEYLTGLYLSDQALLEIEQFTWDKKIREMFISGGGEPTLHWEKIESLVVNSYCNYFQLATSGQWADNSVAAKNKLIEINSWLYQRKNRAIKEFNIRLSVDEFHQKTVPIKNIVNIILAVKEFNHTNNNKITVSIRSLLTSDNTLIELARELNAILNLATPNSGYIKFLSNDYKVYFEKKVLVFDGRFSGGRKKFKKDFTQFNEGKLISHNTYGDRWPSIYKNGVNLGVRPSGKVYIYGASPKNHGNIGKKSIVEIYTDLCLDIVNKLCLEGKHDVIWSIAKSFDPDLETIPYNTNYIGLLVPKSLENPFIRQLVYLKLLLQCKKNKFYIYKSIRVSGKEVDSYILSLIDQIVLKNSKRDLI